MEPRLARYKKNNMKRFPRESESWFGASIEEIRGNSSIEFSKVLPSHSHTVLYHVGREGLSYNDPPKAHRGRDMWDKGFVRMPYSEENRYNQEGRSVARWNIIRSSLKGRIENSHDLEKAILKYNPKYRTVWRFTLLHSYFKEHLRKEESNIFFKKTLPAMVNLTLQLPDLVSSPIPLLRQKQNKSISLSQLQIACLLANAFFCTFPWRNSVEVSRSEYRTFPNINFNVLFQRDKSESLFEKLTCIINYFKRVCTKEPCGVVTFTRISANSNEIINWSQSDASFGSILLHINSENTIENGGPGLLQVNFANSYMGGYVLGNGCAQEEIRFVVYPEFMVSMLFIETLEPNEAVLTIGCEKYNDYIGYANTFKWSKNHYDTTDFDSNRRRKCAVIAIDALNYDNTKDQLLQENIVRELNKAWVGFSVGMIENQLSYLYPGIGTGNWGCGTYGGLQQLKFLIQLMVCCAVHRPLAYFTFKDAKLRDDLINMYNYLSQNNITVGNLYISLCELYKLKNISHDIFSHLIQHFNDQHFSDQKKAELDIHQSNYKDEKPMQGRAHSSQNPKNQHGQQSTSGLDFSRKPTMNRFSSEPENWKDNSKNPFIPSTDKPESQNNQQSTSAFNPFCSATSDVLPSDSYGWGKNIQKQQEIEQASKNENMKRLTGFSKSSWGDTLKDIIGASSPWSAPEFPKIVPNDNHSVLYQIDPSNVFNQSIVPPEPKKGQDLWNGDYVRMPCSPENVYPVAKKDLVNRWDLVKEALNEPINNSHDLERAILKYNARYSWKFTALHRLFEKHIEEDEADHFFKVILPSMIKLTLKLPEIISCPIPLLKQNQNRSVSLSQLQISSLLANAFFCTFPRRNSRNPKSEYHTYPDINFNRLFQSSGSLSILEKLKCICNYFRRVCTQEPTGVVTFTRQSVEGNRHPNWSESDVLIRSIPIHIDSKGTIEDDGVGLLQVDFANKYLGGGVLGHGCVQEEIRFVICPELMASMLFTEVLRPNEALLMIGCERYNNYSGYADSFKWCGNHKDETKRDSNGRLKCAILAIDALSFNDPKFQYRPVLINRELNKAWVGFSASMDNNEVTGCVYPGVATGNWGCGAFRGSPYLKSLIQLMACCLARRPMAYFTFGDTELRDDIINMYNYLSEHSFTVGKLYEYICKFEPYYRSQNSKKHLFGFLKTLHSNKGDELFANDAHKKDNDQSEKKILSKTFYSNNVTACLKSNESEFKPISNAVEQYMRETQNSTFEKMDFDQVETSNNQFFRSSYFDAVESDCGMNNPPTTSESKPTPMDVDKNDYSEGGEVEPQGPKLKKPAQKPITDYFSKTQKR